MRNLLLFLSLAPAALGQLLVNDPVNTAVNTAIKANEVAHHTEILRQWSDQLENLNRQLRQLEAQLTEQRQIRTVLGDPGAAGTQVELGQLGAADLARSFGDAMKAVRRVSDGVSALRYTAEGLYRELGDRTSLGQEFERQDDLYRRYSAVERQAGSLDTVRQQSDARKSLLQEDIASTLVQLRAASTQAEVDKLAAKLTALHGQLAAEEARRKAEMDQLEALHLLNQNQAEKERQDFLEKQLAEEHDSLRAIGTWQRGLSLTPTNYSRR